MEITAIYKTKGVVVKNTHNGAYFDKRNFLIVQYKDESKRFIDLDLKKDITDCDYLEFNFTDKTKIKEIFKMEA